MSETLQGKIDALEHQIALYEQALYDLKERKEVLEEQLQALNDEQQRGDAIDYQKMKI